MVDRAKQDIFDMLLEEAGSEDALLGPSEVEAREMPARLPVVRSLAQQTSAALACCVGGASGAVASLKS